VALEGPLKELQLHDVFQLLELGRKSGVLRVRSELRQTAAVVCFDRGAVVAAGLGDDPPLLGAMLLRAGKITEDDLARARDRQLDGDGRRVGDILVALGAISRRELDRQLKARVEETICELLGWHEGYFRFEEGATPADAIVEAPVRLPTEALLMEAARRLDEWSRIESKVPHVGVVPTLPPLEQQTGARLDLAPFEWELLAAVDGSRDLRDLADVLGRSELEVARTVYGLTSAGVLAVADPSAGAVALGPDPLLDEARRLLTRCDAALSRARAVVDAWGRLDSAPSPALGDPALGATIQRLRSAAATLTHELEHGRD
jgi:hypothetical protein